MAIGRPETSTEGPNCCWKLVIDIPCPFMVISPAEYTGILYMFLAHSS
jgi:hypothetical protein